VSDELADLGERLNGVATTLITCGTSNSPRAWTKSTGALDDEDSGQPFSNSEKEIYRTELITFIAFWQNAADDSFRCDGESSDLNLLRSDCLLRPWNSFCWRLCEHFGAWIEALKPGLIARCDSIKMICFRFLLNAHHPF
jgi:hypothetical protein